MKNNIQQDKENEKIYTAGEVGVLLESIDGGIKVIAEDQLAIRKDIGAIKNDVEDIKSDIIEIKIKLGSVEDKLETKAEKEIAENHEKRITKLEKAVAGA